MEVADQWRRQWSGAAEYGKVTEGGVTRRIARAMEVLHASAPGTRVRVMRAAFHSSAGPGAPASSYLMQSSRQVITSGYNFAQPLALPTKPMEISSTPFESCSDVDNDNMNYKVTEPDDIEISAPSKWKSSKGKSSIRMPSEDSSSTDNASIIDLDSRNSSRNTFSRNQRDSDSNEESIKNIHKRNNRVSPLLDAPTSLSTLKYTSLLNGSEEWNNRRKSYSFEDTTPLNNSFSNNDTFIMDSSTDSGICKSTELVNDHHNLLESLSRRRISKEKLSDLPEESFQDWLHKNRSNTIKTNRVSPFKDLHEQYHNENNISLQSKGKVTITLPVTVENDELVENTLAINNENDKRTKKVGFCKTELHFAAESGTVNIIATDEKRPPSNDFRKKRSVFVPFNNRIDKPITLFGEKSNVLDMSASTDISKNEFVDIDENTAVTKSILKNKIPKPKPYLLGENIDFGNDNDKEYEENEMVSAVTVINKNLEPNNTSRNASNVRTLNSGPQKATFLSDENNKISEKQSKDTVKESSFLYDRHNKTLLAAPSGSLKTRQLRDSDLTYFGIDTEKDHQEYNTQDTLQEEIFHSVKLVQKVSNSVCNSEAESDENQDYQNISNYKYYNIPTPKPRTKLGVSENSNTRILNPIIEAEDNSYRRSRLKKTKEVLNSTSRSISEPPKKEQSHIKRDRMGNSSPKRSVIRCHIEDINKQEKTNVKNTKNVENIYVNVSPFKDERKIKNTIDTKEKNIASITEKDRSDEMREIKQRKKEYGSLKGKHANVENHKPKRTEILTTPELTKSRRDESLKERKNKARYSDKTNSSTHSQSMNSKSLESRTSERSKDNNNMNTLTSKNKLTKDKESNNTEKSTISMLHDSRAETKLIKVRTKDGVPRNKSPEKKKSIESDKTIDKNITKQNSTKIRSKYVINYDDKNGTVSSICKIKPGQDLSKKSHAASHQKYTSDSAVKSKVTNKSGFHQPWNNAKVEQNLNVKEKKSKFHAHKSCQLL